MNLVKYEQALHRLAVYCSRGERCVQELRQKMTSWGLPEQEQGKIIGQLQKENFVDDKRFCRAYVNDKSKYNQWGAYKIRYELKKKQIPDALIQEALSEMDPEANREQLRRLLASKQKTVNGNNAYEIKQKLVRFAVGKGFSIDDIEAVLGF